MKLFWQFRMVNNPTSNQFLNLMTQQQITTGTTCVRWTWCRKVSEFSHCIWYAAQLLFVNHLTNPMNSFCDRFVHGLWTVYKMKLETRCVFGCIPCRVRKAPGVSGQVLGYNERQDTTWGTSCGSWLTSAILITDNDQYISIICCRYSSPNHLVNDFTNMTVIHK